MNPTNRPATPIEVWTRASRQLRSLLRPDVFSRWIAVIEPVDLTENCLTLAVDNDFYQSWLEENYLPLIKDALAAVTGQNLEIRFAIRARFSELPLTKATTPRTPTRPPPRSSPSVSTLNPTFTFNDFIVGPSNSFAHAAALAVAQAPAKAYNPLFIYGGTGLGKTHLMQAIGHHILATSRASVSYLSSETLLNEYIDSLQHQSIVQFRRRYRGVDILLVDDIHFLGGKERIQEEFFHTFNALFDARKQIVMTSDRPASEIRGLEQRLVSRFEWGLVAELEHPDLETRIAILRHKRDKANIFISDDILLWIARNIRSNVRALEGSLIRIAGYASLTGRELTPETLQALLRDKLEAEADPRVTIDSIQRAVAEHYDLRLADLTSKRRPSAIAGPRQIAMFLSRKVTQASLPEIAASFGKTHATVLHACRTIHARIREDALLRKNVSMILEKLGFDPSLLHNDETSN